ncbi:MAG: dipeptidase PepV [Erysipelotrichaceae bacterium]
MNYLEIAQKYKDELLNDLSGLLSIPSILDEENKVVGAPFGIECKMALEYMMNLGIKYGFNVHNVDGYALSISFGDQNDSMGILSHLDVVPAGKGWSTDPFNATIKDGYLFARGILDDKGPAMMSLYALRIIKDYSIKLNKKVVLIFGLDEESEMRCMNYYTNHAEIPSCGFVPDADFPLIYGEKGIMTVKLSKSIELPIVEFNLGERVNVVIGEALCVLKEWQDDYRALFEYYLVSNHLDGEVNVDDRGLATLKIVGRYAHAMEPYKGVNAGYHMLNFIASTYNIVELMEYVKLLEDYRGTYLNINYEGNYMGDLTMNAGIINYTNTILTTFINIRYPNEMDAISIINKLKQHLSDCYNVGLVDDSKPLFVDPNSELVLDLMESYKFYSGDSYSRPKTIGGGTYARKLKNFVPFGPEFPHANDNLNFEVGKCHQANEGFKIEDMFRAIAIYALAIEKIGGK